MTLYHFTCEHIAEMIRNDGAIKPHPMFRFNQLPKVVWLTDLAGPIHRQLGFRPASSAGCDRLEVRFDVEVEGAVRWKHFVKDLPLAQELNWMVTKAVGAEPYHWFVATDPIQIH